MAFAAILSDYMFFREKGEENEYSFIIGRQWKAVMAAIE